MPLDSKTPIPDLGDNGVVDHDNAPLPKYSDMNTSAAPATGFGAVTPGFGSAPAPMGFGTTTPSGGFGAAPSSGFGGGFAVGPTMQQPQPQPNLTAPAATTAANDAEVLVKNSKESEDWINKKWRPVMGWVYMATCTADFVVFPILWSLLQALSKGNVTTQWQPLTLQGAGLYHIAMGAVLGIAAYGRTKEKLESKN
jgi:hypothetical protein